MNEDAQQNYFTVLQNYTRQIYCFLNDQNCFYKYLIFKKDGLDP